MYKKLINREKIWFIKIFQKSIKVIQNNIFFNYCMQLSIDFTVLTIFFNSVNMILVFGIFLNVSQLEMNLIFKYNNILMFAKNFLKDYYYWWINIFESKLIILTKQTNELFDFNLLIQDKKLSTKYAVLIIIRNYLNKINK
jgi:hypothetical protein